MAKKIYNTTSTAKITERNSINELIFNVDAPIEIGREHQAFLKNLYLSIQREIEKTDYSRNWAVREIPLDIPEKDDEYQREAKEKEVTYLVNHFDMNKVDVKLCSLRKDEKGIYHLLVIDGWHTLSMLRIIAKLDPSKFYKFVSKIYIDLTQKQEADIFSSQNEGHTNIRGYERYKAEIVAEKPCALAIQRQLKEFGLTTKNDITSATNRVRNVNAIEELYRIYKKNGEEAIHYTFKLIQDAGWSDSTWAYKQRTLGGIACTYEKGQNPNSRARLLCAMSSVSCEQFLDDALSLGKGDHHSDKVRDYCLSFM